jgi:quercetin dioxygenase-like cupin family protein
MQGNYIFKADLIAHLKEPEPDTIISQVIVKDERLEVTLFQFATGQELSDHTSAFPASLHFLQGEGDMTLGGERVQVKGGSWIYMPANLAHGLEARSHLVMLLTLYK